MSDTLDKLHQEHRDQAKLLHLIERQAVVCGRPAGPDLSFLQLAFQYFQNYPELLHHPKENAVYDRLIARGSTLVAEISDIREDHLRLATRIDAIVRKLAAAEAAGITPPELGMQLNQFAAHYRRHMTIEEAELFPHARTRLSKADWQQIDADIAPEVDPLFDGSASRQYERLFQELLRGGV